MRRTVYTCDRCGKVANSSGEAHYWGALSVKTEHLDVPEKADLCNTCTLALGEWLVRPPKDSPKGKAQQARRSTTKKKTAKKKAKKRAK
jgi:hypothetical protein